MPIYKTNGKKDGLQRYNVRVNYISDGGQPKQLTRVAYGDANAKNLEMRLNDQLKNKGENPVKRMTVQELFNEFMEVKKYELRENSIVKINERFNYYILQTHGNYRIDKIAAETVQNWKLSMEKKNLALNTKRSAFIWFSALINYAVKMEYLTKNPFTQVGNFKSTLNVKKMMKVYTPDEFSRYITYAKEMAEEKERLRNDLSEWNYYVFFNIDSTLV